MEPLNNTSPFAEPRSQADKISLEFLLNKKVYKKIMASKGECPQIVREREDRLRNKQIYRDDILKLFNQLMIDSENTTISQEIHNIFDNFIDKSVSYFSRMERIANPIDYEKDEDDEDEPVKQRKSKVGHSNWGDSIIMDDADADAESKDCMDE